MKYLGCNEGCVCWRTTEHCSAIEMLSAVGLSKKQIVRVLGSGRLSVDGTQVGSRSEFESGVCAKLRLTGNPVFQLPVSPLVVAYDPFFLAADKPAGILVHSDGSSAATLTEKVRTLLRSGGSDVTPQAVQRLDVDTTGLTLFSLTEEFQPAFDRLVAKGGMRKSYLAVVSGEYPAKLSRIEAPIARDRHDSRRMRVGSSGKSAVTIVHVCERYQNKTLLRVELLSGRRHQIRVHLASVGFPLIGDALYGNTFGRDGLMLHAWRESFRHPVTGTQVALEAPIPPRFRQFGFSFKGCR